MRRSARTDYLAKTHDGGGGLGLMNMFNFSRQMSFSRHLGFLRQENPLNVANVLFLSGKCFDMSRHCTTTKCKKVAPDHNKVPKKPGPRDRPGGQPAKAERTRKRRRREREENESVHARTNALESPQGPKLGHTQFHTRTV